MIVFEERCLITSKVLTTMCRKRAHEFLIIFRKTTAFIRRLFYVIHADGPRRRWASDNKFIASLPTQWQIDLLAYCLWEDHPHPHQGNSAYMETVKSKPDWRQNKMDKLFNCMFLAPILHGDNRVLSRIGKWTARLGRAKCVLRKHLSRCLSSAPFRCWQ